MSFDQKIKNLGKKGEDLAADFLIKKGYKIIERNFYTRGGEIDIIAKNKRGEFVFVEVKTRSNKAFGGAIEAVTKSKIRKMYFSAGGFFLRELKMKEVPDFQIDVIAIQVEDGEYNLEHIENVGFDDF
ncbi:MAG: YraN family protein [Candidatus Peregrinibacteria bacterium]|nr:YraN family protein [Candidatus Peregrinibacteria bacterium]